MSGAEGGRGGHLPPEISNVLRPPHPPRGKTKKKKKWIHITFLVFLVVVDFYS